MRATNCSDDCDNCDFTPYCTKHYVATDGNDSLAWWEQEDEIDVQDCRSFPAQIVIYRGKQRRLQPLYRFQKQGYPDTYLKAAEMRFFGSTVKVYDVAEIQRLRTARRFTMSQVCSVAAILIVILFMLAAILPDVLGL